MTCSNSASAEQPLLCPSSQPGVENCSVLGVIRQGKQGPEIAYLDEYFPATEDVLQMAAPARPTQIFRLAATCQTGSCPHFDGVDCSLAARIVQLLPLATIALPQCHIRHECRWFHQEHAAACRRCSQIVSEICNPSEAMQQAIALPPICG